MQRIAGVDEVGRGPLAGAVVAAAVILNSPVPFAKDSKQLTPAKREALAPIIKQNALAFAFGRAEVQEIDSLNIHHATLLAMKRAVLNLAVKPDEVWVDGKFVPRVSMPCKAFIKGDETIELDALYPNYGYKQHKGYGTKLHLAQLAKYGPCEIHRKSFKTNLEFL